MNKLLFTLSFVFILFLSFSLQAQRIKKVDGNPKELQGETKINAVFTYDGMSVGKFEKEEDYINTKRDEYNKKESGRGDKWADSWKADRKARFEPQFIELFEKNTPFALGNFPDAKYTMKINTTRTEPGFNIYITRKNAEIDMNIDIVETASGRKVASYTIKSAPGRTFGGYDFDTGERIEEAYAAAGKHFGKILKGDAK